MPMVEVWRLWLDIELLPYLAYKLVQFRQFMHRQHVQVAQKWTQLRHFNTTSEHRKDAALHGPARAKLEQNVCRCKTGWRENSDKNGGGEHFVSEALIGANPCRQSGSVETGASYSRLIQSEARVQNIKRRAS